MGRQPGAQTPLSQPQEASEAAGQGYRCPSALTTLCDRHYLCQLPPKLRDTQGLQYPALHCCSAAEVFPSHP